LAFGTLSGCIVYRNQPLDSQQFSAEMQSRRQAFRADSQDSQPFEIALCDFERLALVLNPDLRRARLQAGVAEASAAEAGRWLDPVLGGDLLRVLDPDPGQDAAIQGLSLSFTIPVSGRLAVERTHARAETIAALARVSEQEQRLLRDLRIAWAEVFEATELESALIDSRNDLMAISDLATQLKEAGEISTSEAAAFRATHLESSIDLASQQAVVRQANRRLAALAGMRAGTRFRLIPEMEPAATPAEVGDLHTLADRNPHVLIAEAEYHVAEQALRLAIRKQYPDVELGPIYGREDGQGRLGIGFSLPIPILNGNRREIAERTAERDVARAAWEQTLLNAEYELATACEELRRAAVTLVLLQDSLIPLAESRLSESRRIQEAGEINALLLLDALRANADARQAVSTTKRELAIARAELSYLLPNEQFPPTKGTEALKE
jgi:outer membrane protein TolC